MVLDRLHIPLRPLRSQSASRPVTLTLSLDRATHSYKIGEPILLSLAFTAHQPGFFINNLILNVPIPIDTIVIAPSTGVFPWLADQTRGHPYYPDFDGCVPLQPEKPGVIVLTLNAAYRFDAPGRYSIHVITGRALQKTQTFGRLVSNTVTVDITPMSNAEELNRATDLERKISTASDATKALSLAQQLSWLTGDPSTNVKLSLFFNHNDSWSSELIRGLWVARNRALVVSALENAIDDPSRPVSDPASLLSLAASLKSRLESPFNPSAPTAPLPRPVSPTIS